MLHETDTVRSCLHLPDLRTPVRPDDAELDWEDVDLRALAETYLQVMDRFAAANPPPLQVKPLRFRVEDKMRQLYHEVHEKSVLPLLSFLKMQLQSEEMVALMVATLELVRLGAVRAEQRRLFSEIYLRPGAKTYDEKTVLRAQDAEASDGS